MDPSTPATAQAHARPALVVLGPASGSLAERLRSTLEYEVFTSGGPRDAALAVLCGATAAGVEQVHRAFPAAAVMAILAVGADEADMVAIYAAGADLVTGRETVELLVAHARALLRRRAWSAAREDSATAFPSVDPTETSG